MGRRNDLIKVTDALYEEPNNGRRPFKWEAEYETINFVLSDIRIVCNLSAEYRNIGIVGRMSGADVNRNSKYLHAKADIDNDNVFIINPTEGEPTSYRVATVTIKYIPDIEWKEEIDRRRDKGYGMGFLSHWTGKDLQQTNENEPHLALDLVITESYFEQIISSISSPALSGKKAPLLTALVRFYRSEVDKGLEEDWHSRDFHIENASTNPGYFSNWRFEAEVPTVKSKPAQKLESLSDHEEVRDNEIRNNGMEKLLRKNFTYAKYVLGVLCLIVAILILKL